MDAYTLHLLGLAVEACGERGAMCCVQGNDKNGRWTASAPRIGGAPLALRHGPTLADALTALLADLGVEAPQRPSAERARDAERWVVAALTQQTTHIRSATLNALRDLYAREPLMVLALLEGNEAPEYPEEG